MRGTTDRTRAQIKDEFDRLNARVSVGATATNASASIETTRDNLPAALSLLAELLRKPAFPPGEFEIAKQERLAGIDSKARSPRLWLRSRYKNGLRPMNLTTFAAHRQWKNCCATRVG